jgi:thiol-disulfide isomerase/thioredoxin
MEIKMADSAQQGAKGSARTAAVLAALAVLAGFAAVYVTLGRSDNAAPVTSTAPSKGGAPSVQAPPAGPGTNSLSQGHMAAFVFRKEPEALPEIKFQDGEGQERTLADWRGKVVLLNLWATWCLPCRKEMPALDRLQSTLGSDKFQVVAISVDRTGITGAKKFLDETKVPNLAVYADPTARLTSTLRAAGLPATLLIDQEGREVGRLLGPAEWDSEDAKRLIQSAIK